MGARAARSAAQGAALVMLGSIAIAAAPVRAQSIIGRVFDVASGARIAAVAIELVDTVEVVRGRAIADSTGAFRVRAPIQGDYRLRAQMLGYGAVQSDVFRLDAGTELEIEVRLAPEAVALDPIRVVARSNYRLGRLAEYFNRAEFARKTGFGRVFLRDDLESMQPIRISHVLAMVPARRSCPMTYFLDGLPIPLAELDQLVTPEQVEGIEIYRSANEVPPEYVGRTPCGATLVWVRRDIPSGSPITWKVVFSVAAIVLLNLFLMR